MCYNGYMNLPVHPANADAHNIIYYLQQPPADDGGQTRPNRTTLLPTYYYPSNALSDTIFFTNRIMKRLLGMPKTKVKDDSDLFIASPSLSASALSSSSSSSPSHHRLPWSPDEEANMNQNNNRIIGGGPSALASSSSLPFGQHHHRRFPHENNNIHGDDNNTNDDESSNDDVTFGYRYALSAYAHTIPSALSNEDGTLRSRRGGGRVVAASRRQNNIGGRLVPVLEQQHQQRQHQQSLLDDRIQQQWLINAENKNDVHHVGIEGSNDVIAAAQSGGGGAAAADDGMEHRRYNLHPPQDHHLNLESFNQDRLMQHTAEVVEEEGGGGGEGGDGMPTIGGGAGEVEEHTNNVTNENGSQRISTTSMRPPQNFDFLDVHHPHTAINTTDGFTHTQHHRATIHSIATDNLISPHSLNSFRHGSRTNQHQQQHQYRDDPLSVSSQTPSSNDNHCRNDDDNNKNIYLHPNNHLILQPDATYEEHYGDAYVDQTIKYLYPTGYQSMRPRSGPWKLSILIFLFFLWLSVFTVEHCYDRGKAEYNPYFEQADDEYLQDVTDDALVMETRWCGSKVLYFMWMISIWITVLSLSYCSIIGYVKIRDFVVANGRSQPPVSGGGSGGGGRSDYYVAVKNVSGVGGGGGADAGMRTAAGSRGSESGGSDMTSPSSAGMYPSYQVGSDRNRYSTSIYQSDGTPQFWGSHIYRPTQAAVALTNRQ